MIRERKFEYDLIRFLAMVFVVLFHFNYGLSHQNITGDYLLVFAGKNITLGQYGTVLFFMLAGCVSCFSYDSCKTGTSLPKATLRYYVKRFWAMMPAFYIAYFMVLCLAQIRVGALNGNFLFTLLGLDGYLSIGGIKTNYLLGEWFLGAILILYLLFPILYALIRNYPRVMACILVVYFVAFIHFYDFTRPIDATVALHIISFSFGIYCALYAHKINWISASVGFLLALLLFIIKIPVNSAYAQILQGAGSFVALLYIGRKAQAVDLTIMRAVRCVISACAKYSYMVFLIHHVLINRITSPYANMEGPWQWYVLLLLFTIATIAVFSIILYGANAHVVSLIKKIPASVRHKK